MVLYVTDFITSARVATVAEIDSGSTLHDTCLITEVQKSFEKPTILHGATPAETCFAAPLHVSFTLKFQSATAAPSMKSPCRATRKRKPTLSL